MIRFLLDGNVIDELPDGWDDLTSTLKVDRSLIFCRLLTVDTRLTWYRDGYRYLWDKYHGTSGCTEVELQLQEDPFDRKEWVTYYRGMVKLAAANWSYEPDKVDAPVEDDSWYSYLANNKDIEVDVTLPATKNGLPLTPCATVNPLIIDPMYLAPANVNRDMHRVIDVLRYLVDYLTDQQVELSSSVFSAGGKYYEYALQTGYRFRTGLTLYEPLTLTLQDTLSELSKSFNVGCQILTGGAKPVLVIEPIDELNEQQAVLDLNEIHPVQANFDTARLYGTVRVGSKDTVPSGPTASFPETIRWRGFIEEQYYLLGQCNLSAELNLVREWAVSSNLIRDCIYNANQDHDEKVLLLQLDYFGLLLIGKVSNWLYATTSYNYFNEGLTNEQVVRRWLGGIPSTLASELGDIPDGRFRTTGMPFTSTGIFVPPAGPSTWSPVLGPFIFSDDFTPPNFDQGAVYDVSNGRFTAPSAGVFRVGAELNVTTLVRPVLGVMGGFLNWKTRVRLDRYDAASTLLETYYGPYVTISGTNYLPALPGTPSGNVYIQAVASAVRDWPLDLGDYIVVKSDNNYGLNPQPFELDLQVYPTSFFYCENTTDFGDFTQQVDEVGNLNIQLKLRAPVSRREFLDIVADPGGAITVDTNGRQFKGWVESCKYDHSSNIADFVLLTSKKLLPK